MKAARSCRSWTTALLSVVFLIAVVACAPPEGDHEGTVQIEEIPITTTSDTARELFEEGQYLLDVGRGVKAREKFQAAIAEDPGFVRAHVNQSNAALSFKEFQTCLDTASQHLENAGEGEKLMVEINRTLLSNDNERGLDLAQQFVEKFPRSPRARIILAGMQANQNDHDGARASFEKALALLPDSAGALFGIANSYLFGEPKDFAMAEDRARSAIAAYPDEAKAHELMGDIKRAQNDLEAALEAYGQAATTDPTLAAAQHKKGHVNSFLGRIEDARAAYDAGIAVAPPESKAGLAVFKAFTRIHEGDVPRALDELEALADNLAGMGTPADQVKGLQVFALTSHATAALHAGLFDRAEQAVARRNALQMSIARDVGTEDAKRLQEANCQMWDGLLAAYRGDAGGAAEYAEKMAELVASDDNPRKMEPYHWVLGMSALRAGDHGKAVEHLRQADYKNNMYIRYRLAEAEEGAGNVQEAKKLFGEVATFNFNSVGFALVREEAKRRAAS